MKCTNDRGFTLIELIVALTITGIMIFMAGVGIAIFFSKFEQLNMYADLQNDAFDTMHTFKHGMIIEGSDSQEFLGIMVADTVFFYDETSMNVFRKIKCSFKGVETLHHSDYVEFYYDSGDRAVKANYRYGNDHPSTPITVFPVEHADDIRVTNLYFTDSDWINGGERLIGVHLDAEMDIGDDLVKQVHFETRIKVR